MTPPIDVLGVWVAIMALVLGAVAVWTVRTKEYGSDEEARTESTEA